MSFSEVCDDDFQELHTIFNGMLRNAGLAHVM